ncbi:MAG: hypothetical protein FJX80_05380 [Bacteroidetes bacterium]|nr:hypothetical protein [Bacteroidota bacterium]
MEKWRVILGFTSYKVSNLGRIRSLERTKIFKNGRVMKYEGRLKNLRKHPKNGFMMVDLINDHGLRKTLYPHKIVALAFLHNMDLGKKKVVVHIDGNVENNASDNLKWSSFSESIKFGFDNGTRSNADLWMKRRLKYGPKGGNNSQGRPDPLSFAQKKRIQFLRKEKGYSLKRLSLKYKCSISHIHKTISRFSEKLNHMT